MLFRSNSMNLYHNTVCRVFFSLLGSAESVTGSLMNCLGTNIIVLLGCNIQSSSRYARFNRLGK